MSALKAFENWIRNHPTYSVKPDEFLKKLESHDPTNPEFRHQQIDEQWVVWKASWEACSASA